MLQQRDIKLYGRVQGVYLRKTIQRCARELGITGTVKNIADGSVHVRAYGEIKQLDIFTEQCKKGSVFSSISETKIHSNNIDDILVDSFEIFKTDSFLTDQKNNYLNFLKNLIPKKNKFQGIIPKHLVIIPNGNRSWSKQKGLDSWRGYWKVFSNIKEMYRESLALGIDHFSFWAFSTENWKRDPTETKHIFDIIEKLTKEFEAFLVQEQIKFKHLGRKDRIPESLAKTINKLEDLTKDFKKKSLNLALDYGGRDEITRAINQMLSKGIAKVSEEEISSYLDTTGIPDPDLIIRTAGEQRLSGMMPWQSVYSEFYVSEKYFPDFNIKDLRDAIADFGKRKRSFGGNVNINIKA